MKSRHVFYFVLNLLFSSFLFLQGCKNESVEKETSIETKNYDAKVALSWNSLLVEIDRYSPNYRPPAAARMMAYVGLAAYESVVPGMPEYRSLGSEFAGLQLPKPDLSEVYYWPASANASYAAMFRSFYPHISDSDKGKIDQLEKNFEIEFANKSKEEVLSRSKKFGTSVAAAVFEFSKSDIFGHEAYKNPRPSSYIPPKVGPNGEKLWQPTFPDFTPALFPYWGSVRTFALKKSDLRAKPPIPYSEDVNSLFYQQANEARIVVNNLSYQDKWIAEFWSDDFFQVTFEPAARQMAIANQMVKTDNISLDRAVELYAKEGMAMCDAAIAIWNSKYIYNVRRPIEYIRENMQPGWTTILNHPYTNVKSLTPEFPSYPSGHSGFGGSSALILTDIFGNNRTFTDNCHKDRFDFIGTPRSYNSFIEAGIENAYSRIPLGVHYRMDCDEGLRLGYLAATRVIELPWKK